MDAFLVSFLWVMGGIVSAATAAVALEGTGLAKRLSGEAQVAALVLAGLLCPVTILVGLAWVTRWTPHGLAVAGRATGRGVRDLYRAFVPAKVRVPRMQVVRRRDEQNAGNTEQGVP